MTAEAMALMAAYLMCSEAAEVRVLDRNEAAACVATYTEVKLSFLPDVTLGGFEQMSATERAEVNVQGYAAYVAWRTANPALVTDMEAEARRQLASTDS